MPRGTLPFQSDEGAHRKILRTPPKGTRILFHGCVPNSFPPLRGTNSTTTNYITGTANFNTVKPVLSGPYPKSQNLFPLFTLNGTFIKRARTPKEYLK